jgi:hypothetical protein
MKFKFSIGNQKIGKDTLIFNMGSATKCPSKLNGLCDINCYALKSEKLYPSVLPARNHQEDYWLKTPHTDIINDIKKAIKKRPYIKYIRVNESGDFHYEACLHKLIFIAEQLPNIKFYTYTHRSDLINDDTHRFLPKNLVINTSNFKRKNLNQFKAVKVSFKFTSYKKSAEKIKAELKETYNTNLVCGGDCSKCNLCKLSHSNDILVALH